MVVNQNVPRSLNQNQNQNYSAICLILPDYPSPVIHIGGQINIELK